MSLLSQAAANVTMPSQLHRRHMRRPAVAEHGSSGRARCRAWGTRAWIGVRLLIRESTRAIGPARPAKTRRDARPPD